METKGTNETGGRLTPIKRDGVQVFIESEKDEGQMRCSFRDDLHGLRVSQRHAKRWILRTKSNVLSPVVDD